MLQPALRSSNFLSALLRSSVTSYTTLAVALRCSMVLTTIIMASTHSPVAFSMAAIARLNFESAIGSTTLSKLKALTTLQNPEGKWGAMRAAMAAVPGSKMIPYLYVFFSSTRDFPASLPKAHLISIGVYRSET